MSSLRGGESVKFFGELLLLLFNWLLGSIVFDGLELILVGGIGRLENFDVLLDVLELLLGVFLSLGLFGDL